LGNTLFTSAYQIANNLPNMVYELCASGILGTAVFVPLYLLQKEKHGKEAAQRFSNNLLTLTTLFLGLLSLVCAIAAPAIIQTQTFTVGAGETKDLAIFFFRIFAIQILLYGLNAVVMGVLNAERDFLASALAPILNNLIVIVTMFGFVPLSAWDTTAAMWWLGMGTSLGVAVQLLGQLPALMRGGFKFKPVIDLHDPMLKEALKLAAPMFLYVAGTMITISCRNAFALDAASNGPSTLSYARMWWQLPYGVIAVSLSTTLLTELSECAARADWEGFKSYVSNGLRSTLFLMMPLAAMVGALAVPLIQLFRAGAFTAEDVAFVSEVLAVWTISLPFYAGYMYFYKVFASMRSFVLFACIDVCMRIVQALLYSQLCKPENFGLVGIPLGDIFFYGGMFLICSVIVHRKVGSFGFGGVLKLVVKGGAASLVAAAVVYALVCALGAVPVSLPLPTIAVALVEVCVLGVFGLVVAFGLCKLIRVKEYEQLSGILKRLRGKLKRA
ncbi:MAG: murein biosynthesis integral membrane protein MurJ, partial [Coriobacteriia bacterium]|nr:murein biosynthesis integral membrane protein MurJ [Coriobacteriia bacterium]